jgi:hypothetical protein
MQWQLIPETTMHAFDINALLTMITINKLTDRTGNDTIFFPQCKNDQCGSKNTNMAVPEKLTINFFLALSYYFMGTNSLMRSRDHRMGAHCTSMHAMHC